MTSELWNSDEPLLDGGACVPEAAWARPGVPEGLREALLQRTTTLLRRRRRVRRVVTAGGWVCAYAAGVLTAYVAIGAAHRAEMPNRATVEVGASQPASSPAGADLAELPPWELEQRAESAPVEQRRELLRLAGDRYLDDYGDVQAALRCYRLHLDSVPPQEQSHPQPDDNWLLASLKQARQTEVTDEKS